MPRTPTRAVAAVAALLTAGGSARAQEVQVSLATELAWHGENHDGDATDDQTVAGAGRLFASATRGAFTLAARLDLVGFVPAPLEPGAPEGGERYRDRATLEKVWLTWQGRDVEITAGDSYVAFGRGLGLTLRKVDGLNVDTTLRGARVAARLGRIEAVAAAGVTNIVNVDVDSGRAAGDPLDLAAGGQVLVQAGSARIGGHVETIAFHRPLEFIPDGMPAPRWADRWMLAGPIFDAPRLARDVGLYAEGIVQDRGDARGFGAYAAATWYVTRTSTLLCEAKAYGDLQVVQPRFADEEAAFQTVRYTAPPTGERLFEPLEHAQRDTWGARVRLDRRLAPELTAHANLGLFRDHLGYLTTVAEGMPPELRPGTILDPYAGIEGRWHGDRSQAALAGGARLVFADDSGALVRQTLHVDWDAAQAITRRLSARLHGSAMRRGKDAPPFIHERWLEATTQAGVALAGRWSVSAIWDVTTEMLAPQRHYLAAAFEWKPTSSLDLSLFAGGMRGGLKCISGVCRELPPFQGVRFALTVRH